jgi:RecB family exonuclease
MFSECPRKYKFSYVDGIRGPAKMNMRRGTAYHNSLEKLLTYKLKYGELLDEERTDKLALKCAKLENLSDTEIYHTIDAVRFYHQELYAKHRPLAVEEPFDVEIGGVRCTGRIDLIEDTGWVIDHKFSNDTWAETRAEYGCQPAIYQFAALRALEQKFPGFKFAGFAYQIIRLYPYPLIQGIKIPKLNAKVSNWWEDQIGCLANAVRTGYFPARPEEKTCKWCDHKKPCGFSKYQVDMEYFGEAPQAGTEAAGGSVW